MILLWVAFFPLYSIKGDWVFIALFHPPPPLTEGQVLTKVFVPKDHPFMPFPFHSDLEYVIMSSMCMLGTGSLSLSNKKITHVFLPSDI